MGFRSGAYCTIWSVERKTDTVTRCRVSISRKDKNTGEYVQDFGGFLSFIGTACAKKALSLHEKQRIKLGDVDVSNRYDKASGKEYTNFNVYSFELEGEPGSGGGGGGGGRPVDHGEPDDSDLPF